MVSTFFPPSNNGEEANVPLYEFDDVYSGHSKHSNPSGPTGGLHDIITSGFLAPRPTTTQPCPIETTSIREIGSDEFYGAIQSSKRLKAIEADLTRTLMSEINVLDSSHSTSSPLDLLTNRRPSYSLFNGDKNDYSPNTCEQERELSTEEVMRVAALRFIQSSACLDPHPAIHKYPFGFSISFSALSPEEIENVDLADLLLAAAEMVSRNQYLRAGYLIDECYRLSSSNGNPVQRVVHHFANALQERVERETDNLVCFKRPRESLISDINNVLLSANLQLVFHSKVAFPQILQFISVQTIIDAVELSTKIHVIDFSLRHGMQWTVLIQELASRTTCTVEYLKVTAVGSSAEAMAMSGERLAKFAQNLGLNFEFQIVVVKEMTELSEDMFEVRKEEVLCLYFSSCLNAMIVNPGDLEHLMKVGDKMRPEVMTVVDIEGSHNSPSFINRFTEALFYYSALFDSMDGFMERNDTDRLVLEGRFFSDWIKSIVAAEGTARVVRHVGIKMWRSFFRRFGLRELEMNEWSPYQAGLIAKQFKNGSSCSLHRNGKSLMVGWKGTPLFFVSAWKFL